MEGVVHQPVHLARVLDVRGDPFRTTVGAVGLLHQVDQPGPYHRPVAPAPQDLGDVELIVVAFEEIDALQFVPLSVRAKGVVRCSIGTKNPCNFSPPSITMAE
jgi:hypothetical protein